MGTATTSPGRKSSLTASGPDWHGSVSELSNRKAVQRDVSRSNPLAHRERGLHINPLLNGRSIDLRGTTYPGALPKDLEPHPFSPASVSRLSRLRPGPVPDNTICHLPILFPRLRLRLRLLDCYRLPAPDSRPYRPGSLLPTALPTPTPISRPYHVPFPRLRFRLRFFQHGCSFLVTQAECGVCASTSGTGGDACLSSSPSPPLGGTNMVFAITIYAEASLCTHGPSEGSLAMHCEPWC